MTKPINMWRVYRIERPPGSPPAPDDSTLEDAVRLSMIDPERYTAVQLDDRWEPIGSPPAGVKLTGCMGDWPARSKHDAIRAACDMFAHSSPCRNRPRGKGWKPR